MSAAIILDRVSKQYRLGEHVLPFYSRCTKKAPEKLWALKDVSFSVSAGEVLGVIGSNGAGKSTLMRLIAGLTKPSEGTITRRGNVGTLLGLGLGVHAELTGRENIYMTGSLHGMKTADIQKQFDTIVEFAELEKFIDTPVKFYSSGMRARLSFSTVMHLEHPDIMLIDEVLAAGDIAFKQKALYKIKEFTKSGRTVVIASHGVGRLKEIADRCLYLDHGVIQALGDTKEVVHSYQKNMQALSVL